MKVAVVGSREGFPLDDVGRWLAKLWDKQGPTTTLVSGGAPGVDHYAEQTWLAFGGQVISFRPKKVSAFDKEDEYGVEVWHLGGDQPHVATQSYPFYPTFADYGSAAAYRDMLIAEEADRCMAFRYNKSRGTSLTIEFFENAGKPVYVKEVPDGT